MILELTLVRYLINNIKYSKKRFLLPQSSRSLLLSHSLRHSVTISEAPHQPTLTDLDGRQHRLCFFVGFYRPSHLPLIFWIFVSIFDFSGGQFLSALVSFFLLFVSFRLVWWPPLQPTPTNFNGR